ncbi:MAG: OB-fold domain-containing protein [Blastomonas fulva]|uniref:Zn-ribbon domain-containing OB-fold protein n=1 Tax=Blastomonas fulva TaxID=1550728 RepID=UPI0024E1C7B3|nr:OB-fold domain-containing protein [Blastomonas fulva]MDK2756025.1 OB-fold domain-containing protein [Blastomonas fulva]
MALPLPAISPETAAFWTGGAHGALQIMACNACDHRIHPPQLICPQCLSRDVAPIAASGQGTIYSYTINHQPWIPDLKVPYALVIVDLDDQPGVRMTAMLETNDLGEIAIGAPVTVDFEHRGDVYVPFFRLG